MTVSPRIFGRTNRPVPFLWKPLGAGAYGDESWCAVEIGPEALDRRSDPVVIERLASLGLKRCDVLIVQDLLSNDLKVGWPTHRLMQLREKGLCDWFAIEIHTPLEAEWIAGNAPVYGIVAPYSATDMGLRYRAFEAAQNAGVAIVSRAASIDDVRLQLATPQICATIVDDAIAERATHASPLQEDEVEALWQAYQASTPAPAKLRSGHPPDFGV